MDALRLSVFSLLAFAPADSTGQQTAPVAGAAIPTPDQLAWTDLEVGALITWGINTELPAGTKIGAYTTKGPAMCGGCSWGLDRLPSPGEFNPTRMDVDAYVQAAKDLGANYLVLSASHCSGFLLWPSKVIVPGIGRYNYSVAFSPWRDGQGDVVSEFVDACGRHGMRYGLYINLGLNMYLNVGANSGSHTVYPKGRFTPCVEKGSQLLPGQVNVTREAYFSTWLLLLEELLGGLYGTNLTEVWFDGGYPDELAASVGALISRTQPHMVAFQGPNRHSNGSSIGNGNVVRWAGTETGHTPSNDMWSTVNAGETQTYGPGVAGGDEFDPAEQDGAIQGGLNAGGFWYRGESTKSATELLAEYEASVGHNANFMLELAPDNTGQLPAADVAAYKALGQQVSQCYRSAKSVVATLEKSPCGQTVCLSKANASGNTSSTSFAYNRIVIQEDQSNGQRVRSYSIDAKAGKTWSRVAAGFSIGHERIHVFKSSSTVSALRLSLVTEAGAGRDGSSSTRYGSTSSILRFAALDCS